MTNRQVMFWCALTILAALAVIFSLPAQAQTGSHQAALAWGASPDATTNPSLAYNVYRMTAPCPTDGSFPSAGITVTKVASAITSLSFTDTTVQTAQTYCYAVTAELSGIESRPMTAQANIPLASPGQVVVVVK